MFDIVGNLLFPDGLPFFVPNAQHPFWNPEFLGDVMVVNGRSWPFLDVFGQRYRIRLLNGSNARFYNLTLAAAGKGKKVKAPPFWVIGTDGGLLDEPVMTNQLLIAPGERYDVILDFAGKEGTTFVLKNDAKSPYPFGETANPQTVGQIAQFIVDPTPPGADATYNPDPDAIDFGGPLRDLSGTKPAPIDRLPGTPAGDPIVIGPIGPGNNVQKIRQLTLNEIPGPFGPLDAVLNNTRWGGERDDGTFTSDGATQSLTLSSGTVAPVTNYMTEFPQVGSTEVWKIINLTGDAHPIHLHLVQFQVVDRQGFNVKQYEREYLRRFPGGAAANPNSGIFIPHFGPPQLYDNTTNPDFCPSFFDIPSVPCDGAPGNPDPPTTLGGNPDITPFLSKSPIPPSPYELGWKDTVIALPKQVTTIVVRWKQQDGTSFVAGAGFDPTAVGNPVDGVVLANGEDAGGEGGPGYVWHCHIIDHEDNEMMRPYVPVNNADNMLD
jgi:FtsP/CotA-like multicopper oxidase with cupredoxin domain